MEVSYSSLKKKDVICINTGRNIGKISDLIFEYPSGIICGFIIPSSRFSLFCQTVDTYIGLENIKKIGSDAVLVDLTIQPQKQPKIQDCI